MSIKDEILKLKKEKNAVIMAHYYQDDDIQEVANFIGDSLAIAKHASKLDADIIVMCGVHFMGETVKILSPNKKVLIPDMAAGCSLADSCKAEDLSEFLKDYKGYKVISYVNTLAAVKALTDIVVTSSNAKKIVDSLPQDEKIVFGPDKNLGSYINRVTGRNMVLWNGHCHVHDRFSLEHLKEQKKQFPDAMVLAHPECKQEILELSDYVGSTAGIIDKIKETNNDKYIVVTEVGVFYQIKKENPNKTIIPAFYLDEIGGSCNCNKCEYMRMINLEKLYNCLKNETPEIVLESEELRLKALKSIERMLALS